ncbi:MAG: hypothetical protein NUV75_02440 [Gallionella sp.]|nr:hypothetical protein [Gallionella sp.]
MLSSIFGKKSDHPMADIKSAQALLDDLPKNDAHKMLMELTEWIESVADNTGFKLDHRFEMLRLLDETAQPYARKLARDYFTPQELNKFQENRLWLALGNWSSHTARAYFAVFDRYCSGDKGASNLKAQLPLLAARAVYALTGQLKYICAHYGPIDNAIWGNLARIHQHAEQQQYLDTPLALYSGMAGNTTVKGELGRLLGWYGCGVNTLKPLYMHLTERIVGQYCTGIDVGVQQDANSLFSFDLDRPAAPVCVKAGVTAHSSIRFISMAAMRPKLATLIKTLGKGTVPEDLNLGGIYDAELVREAAQYLLNYLTAPPLRRSARRGIKVNLNVVNGFTRVIERTGAGLNFSEEQPANWDIEDISASGFRTVLPAQGTDGIRIGSLLGVQPGGVQHWGVAVIRRLMRDGANQLQVGAEMLANQIAAVALSQSGGGGGGFENGQPALWLRAKQGDPSGEARLLMRADTFSPHRSLQTRLDGKNYLLIPLILQEKGEDYDLARFRLIEQESSSE